MDGNVDKVNTPDAPGLCTDLVSSGAAAPMPPGASFYRYALFEAASTRALGLFDRARRYERCAERVRAAHGLPVETVCIPRLGHEVRPSATDGARLRALVTRALARIGDDAAFTTRELAVVTAIFAPRWLTAPRRSAVAMVEGHLRAWARTASVRRQEDAPVRAGRVTKAVRRRAGRVLCQVRRALRRRRMTWGERAGYVWLCWRAGVGEALPQAMAGEPGWSGRAWRFGLGTGLPFTPRADATTFELLVGIAGVQADCDTVPAWAAREMSDWVQSFGPRADGVWQQLFEAAGVRP